MLTIIYLSICLNVCLNSANELDLSAAIVSQVGTWNNHFANMAIDGNVKTYSVACIRCDGSNPTDAVGWWKIDFNQEVDIAGVELTSSHDHPDKDYLQETILGVSSYPSQNLNDYAKCGEHDSRNVTISPNQKIVIVCPQNMRGRSIIVRRKDGALIRPDTISIAEAKFYSDRESWIPNDYYGNNNQNENNGQNGNNGNNGKNFKNNVQYGNDNQNPNCLSNKPIGMRDGPIGRPVSVKNAIQSATYGTNNAGNAIDGNKNTFSIAVSNQYWQNAWWQGDLGLPYQVTGLTVISSPDFTNAQYLKTFEVLVSQYNYVYDPSFKESQKCITVSDSGVIPTQTMIAFKCATPLFGRFVTLKSTAGPISLAEMEVYIQ